MIGQLSFLKCLLITVSIIANTVSLAFGQKLNTDSLANLIQNTKEDTTLVLDMRKLASYQILHENKEEQGLALLREVEVKRLH